MSRLLTMANACTLCHCTGYASVMNQIHHLNFGSRLGGILSRNLQFTYDPPPPNKQTKPDMDSGLNNKGFKSQPSRLFKVPYRTIQHCPGRPICYLPDLFCDCCMPGVCHDPTSGDYVDQKMLTYLPVRINQRNISCCDCLIFSI